ncbi:ribulose phosphate epimerase [Enhygromyxa salina]|uniref:Uncharacterized protein n=1 Tax=Enhygromyxa salina TaxID=215803 RepID=A0A2S9XTN3_9BACT|nr:ribulose phosphate epimerase [Enhygromyxa salina]PRP96225.1 hypothetical protein ENSA7_70390 [Enhygromyxa salina]
MSKTHASFILLSLLTGIACGPAGITAQTSTDETDTSSAEVTAESSSTDPEPTSTTETSSTDDGTETFGFVPDYDGATSPASCDMFMQDCPDGEKCVPYSSTGGSWDDHKCVPILGDQAPGESCTLSDIMEATDNCDAISYCWDVQLVDGEPVGTCAAFCTGTPDDPKCPPGSACLISGDSTITLCIFTCDPLVQDCDQGLACYWANDDFNCIFTTRDIPAGQPCGFINDCALGLMCVSGESLPDCAGSACCSPFCALSSGDASCAAVPGTSCVPFFDVDPPPNYEDVGICVVP